VRRVRYCLQTSGLADGRTVTPQRGVLWRQTQTWITPADPLLPIDTGCPGAGWTTTVQQADYVVNRRGGLDRPLFRYSGDAGAITATDAASRADITRVQTDAWVDLDTTRNPVETNLASGVVLRNQNREPKALFTITVVGTHTVQLNGSQSEDPEAQPLTYEWYVDGVKQTETGVVIQKAFSAGAHTFMLRVSDPAGLTGDSKPQTQTI
jgi:hypothetical protein